jgi:hypothetical protein
MYVCMCMCMYVWARRWIATSVQGKNQTMYVCACICVFVCMYIFVCMCVCVYINARTERTFHGKIMPDLQPYWLSGGYGAARAYKQTQTHTNTHKYTHKTQGMCYQEITTLTGIVTIGGLWSRMHIHTHTQTNTHRMCHQESRHAYRHSNYQGLWSRMHIQKHTHKYTTHVSPGIRAKLTAIVISWGVWSRKCRYRRYVVSSLSDRRQRRRLDFALLAVSFVHVADVSNKFCSCCRC